MKNLKQNSKTEATTTPVFPLVNPWNNKTKIRGEGLLNDIMNKHLNQELEFEEQQHHKNEQRKQKTEQILSIARKIIEKYKMNDKIEGNTKKIFELKKKCETIDKITQWIEKIESRSSSGKEVSALKPIDSNFIYLPLHSGTVFHEILQDCVAKDRNKGIGEYRNAKLREFMAQIGDLGSTRYGKLLENNIL